MSDDLAEAIRRANLVRALTADVEDVIRTVADRLGLSINDTQKLAAAMLDAMTSVTPPTVH